MQVIKSQDFLKLEKKWLERHPDLKSKYEKTLTLLELDWHHPSLRLHKVNKFFSVSINMQWRVSLDFIEINGELHLLRIHDHQY